jgi:tRNA(adenine34) deaminase
LGSASIVSVRAGGRGSEASHCRGATAAGWALASLQRGSWRLDDVTAYVTLEPCAMCAGAFVNARVPRVVYGCDDPRAGAVRSLYRLGEDPRLNHRYEVVPGVLAAECAELLRGFFRALRARRG